MTDTDRFRRMFEEHRGAVFGFAVRRVGRDLADEVLAETFLVAWRRLADVPADAELRWLLVTARLVLANISRSSRRRDRLLDRTEGVHARARSCPASGPVARRSAGNGPVAGP